VSLLAQEAFERIVISVAKTSEAIRQIAESTTSQQAASREVSELITALTIQKP
jgi:methyl-accepting chemotaxis protein